MTNKFKIFCLFICIAVAFSIVSCDREEGPDGHSGSNDNTPLTSETIVGRKYYTDKLPGFCWCQWEIRFAANGVAYLTETRTYYENGQEIISAPIKANYNLVYPDVVFEDEDGNNYPATFIDNNTMVFNGDNIEEDSLVFRFTYFASTTKPWGQFSGWHFRSTPNTITGPYVGQKYTGSTNGLGGIFEFVNSCSLSLGAGYAACKTDYYNIGRLIINYPNISIGTNFLEGRYVDENTIVLTKYNGNDIQGYNIRLRNINAGPDPGPNPPDPGDDNDDDTTTINLPTTISETFANSIPSNWINIDADGDGHMWASTITTIENLADADGNGAVYSQSWDNDYGALTPDNYLVTPKIHINGGTLSWQVAAQDSGYPNEHYAVLIGRVVNGNFVTIATLFEETFSGNSKSPTDFYNRSVSLSDYSGHNLRIAFRHYDCTDNFCLNIDNVVIQ